MVAPFLLLSSASLTAYVAADVSFTKTINLGAILLGVMIALGFAWASRQDKRTERWRELYELADTERKEVQDDLKEAREIIAEQKEVIGKLEALQMPTRVMEIMAQGIQDLDEHAAVRQLAIVQSFEHFEKQSDLRLQRLLAVLDMIAAKLGADPEH